MRSHRRPGAILGSAGGSLTNASWAANSQVAQVGQRGEQRTAQLLNDLASQVGGPTVLHDLRIPITGISANIDHVVVAGKTVHIIDTKVWRPAFYWTLGGKTRRGLERFEPAEKKTMAMAYNALSKVLAGTGATIATPTVAIWPSSTRTPMRIWALSMPGASCVTGQRLASMTRGRRLRKPADERIVSVLSQLLLRPFPLPSRRSAPPFAA